MATTLLPQDFREFLRLLNENHVEYLVIGGYAVAHHGYVGPTGGLDVRIPVHPANTGKLLNVLRAFGFGDAGLSADLLAAPGAILRMGVPPVRIEIQTSVSGVAFDECYRDRVQVDCDGVVVNMIDLEHLKLNKKAAGRNKDLADLENLP